MTLYLSATETLKFLESWFSCCPEGQLAELRPLNRRPGQRPLPRKWAPAIEDAFNYVSDCLRHGDDVYIGALPRARKGGKADDVGSHRWLWGDVDYGTVGHSAASAYATRDEALAAIRAFPMQPTLLVDTGGGFHGWWVLDAEPEITEWRDAIERLAHAIRADTNAIDEPRILRVPGTFNFKVDPPRPVLLVDSNSLAYPIGDFLKLRRPPETTTASAVPPRSENRPFDRANDVPIGDVLAWLGVEMHREGTRVFSACPVHRGTNGSQMIVGGTANTAHCFGDCGRSYSPVDVVAAVRGIEPKEAVNALAAQFGFDGFVHARQTETRVSNDLAAPNDDATWKKLLDYRKDPDGKPTGLYPGVKNTSLILLNDPAWKGLLAYDEFWQTVVARREPPCLEWARPTTLRRAGRFGEDDYARARLWVTDAYRVPVSKDVIYESVAKIVSKTQAFHPVRDYLLSLESKWDGSHRIPTFAKVYLGAKGDPATAADFVRWFLVSAVARIFEPGCKADSMIILEGEQGLGKSTAIRILAGQYVADSPIQIGTKDAFIALCGVWIAELAELESLLRSDPDAVKAFLSSPVDRYRPPYARDAEDFPRQCVFAGTVNHLEYLKDPTGARRFWPIQCAAIDLHALRRDRDQIWGEALRLYRAGTAWWPSTPEELVRCERAQDRRYQADAWEAAVREYMLAPKTNVEVRGVTVAEILSNALSVPKKDHDRARQARVIAILERFGFNPARPRRSDGARPRAYLPPPGWVQDSGGQGDESEEAA